MNPKKRVRVRIAQVLGRVIPLDLCWDDLGRHRDFAHVHNAQPQDDMGGALFAHVKEAMVGDKRWCRQCVTEYTVNTPESRAFYEVVRLNNNEFTGNLPPEIIMEIYKRLLKKPILFTECSSAKAAGTTHP